MDDMLLRALGAVRDKLVVAMADVERGDHLRACEALDAANATLAEAIEELREAA